MNVKLTILSGSQRGRTLTASHFPFRLGAAADCDLTLEGEPDIAEHQAEIVQEDCDLFLRKLSPVGLLLVNRKEVSEIILKDQDLIGLGLDGPRIRFRLPSEEYLACKPIIEICRDCVDMAKLAEMPWLGKIGVFMRQAGRDLAYQTTRLFKVSMLALLLGLLATAGIYLRWSNQQFHHYERALQRLGEKSEKERRTLTVRFERLQEATRKASAREEQRVERLKDALGETSRTGLERLGKELENLRWDLRFAPQVVDRSSGGVCFIVGGYGFVEKTSGKMLRFVGFDSQGQPLKDASGRIRFEVRDQGEPAVAFLYRERFSGHARRPHPHESPYGRALDG